MINSQLKNPFTMTISGPTKSGKSQLLADILYEARNHNLFTRAPGTVYYFYNIWSQTFNKMKEQKTVDRWFEGACDINWLKENIIPNTNSTVVIDDQAGKLNQDIVDIFSVGSHQLDCNVIFLTQTLFSRNQYSREISLNSAYLVLMKNPRDKSSISYLARQISPQNPDVIINAFFDATKHPYSHFLIDFNQETHENLRLKSNILGQKNIPITVYLKELE